MDGLRITKSTTGDDGIRTHVVERGTYYLDETVLIEVDERVDFNGSTIVSSADIAVSVPGGWRPDAIMGSLTVVKSPA